MKSIIEKNAARIIITTLIALVIVGIVTGVGIPYNVDNYDPGHSILEIGNPNYYFVESDWGGSTPKKYLALEEDAKPWNKYGYKAVYLFY